MEQQPDKATAPRGGRIAARGTEKFRLETFLYFAAGTTRWLAGVAVKNGVAVKILVNFNLFRIRVDLAKSAKFSGLDGIKPRVIKSTAVDPLALLAHADKAVAHDLDLHPAIASLVLAPQ